MKAKLTLLRTYWFLFLISLVSCQEEAERGGLRITDIAPKGGNAGTVVTIIGEGFSSVVQENNVTIGDTEVEVLSATETEIKAKVPEGIAIDCYQLRVDREGFIYTSEQFCVTEFPLPKVTDIYPETGSVGDLVTIYGENLGTSTANNRVAFSDKNGAILFLMPADTVDLTIDDIFSPLEFGSMDSIQVRVPEGAGTGTIYIWVDPDANDGAFEKYYTANTPTFTVTL